MKQNEREELLHILKNKLSSTTGIVHESLKYKISILETPLPKNLLSTELVLPKTLINRIINKEKRIIQNLNNITITESEITDAVRPLKNYCLNKIFLLNQILKKNFKCYKTKNDKVSGTFFISMGKLKLDPGIEVSTIEIFTDRKKVYEIDLKNYHQDEIHISVMNAEFIEFFLVENIQKKLSTRVGLTEIPCSYFVENTESNFILDFLNFNFVEFNIVLKTTDKLGRNNAQILCLRRCGHILEKLIVNDNFICNICFEDCKINNNAYKCTECQVLVHNKCLNFIFFRCKKNNSNKHSSQLRANFNIPHIYETIKNTKKTYCHHCGAAIKPDKMISKCKLCNIEFHIHCSTVAFNSCGISKELRIQLSCFNTTDKLLNMHLMNIKSIDEFDLIKELGKGTFSTVMLGIHKKDKIKVAFKIIKKKELLENFDIQRIESEKCILDFITSFDSPFFTKILYFYQDATHIYFGLEYCPGGDLLSYFLNNDNISEDQIKQYVVEIIIGLCILHQNNIIYRDLKLDNIMISETGHIKLCDCGLSKQNMELNTPAFTFCGTPDTMAPEIIKQTGYTRVIDFWSLGIIIYEMFHKTPPFSAPTLKSLSKAITFNEIKITAKMSSEAKDFILQLTEKNPLYRLGHGVNWELDIKGHPWFKDINWEDVIFAKNKVFYKPKNINTMDSFNYEKDKLKLSVEQLNSETEAFFSQTYFMNNQN